MDQIEQFIHLLLEEFEPDADTEAAKAALLCKLRQEYDRYLAAGMPPKAAATQVLFFFGAREGVQAEVARQRLLSRYRRFQHKYPILVRCGFLGILFIPALVMVLFLNLEGKLTALAGWVVSIIALVTFIICLEYIDYRYRKLLKLGPGRRRSIKESSPRRDPQVETPLQEKSTLPPKETAQRLQQASGAASLPPETEEPKQAAHAAAEGESPPRQEDAKKPADR